MKNIFELILVFTIIAFMSACSSSDVRIRIQNDSTSDFKKVFVQTNNDSYTYAEINAGEYSQYDVHEEAYGYAFIELEINDSVFTIQPIDFIGATLLESGDYTYRLETTADTSRYGRLFLSLIKE